MNRICVEIRINQSSINPAKPDDKISKLLKRTNNYIEKEE